jgi:hypothetical protein
MSQRLNMDYVSTRWIFQRCLGFIYFIGFLIALNQGLGLIGEHGLLPATLFVQRVSFSQAPSLYFFAPHNSTFLAIAWAGLLLSILAIFGITDRFQNWISALSWLALWILYLSIVNVGQTFYGFGWETLLLETGVLAIFLGATNSKPSVVVVWLLRWLLFRLMFGAGLIKIRGDECWRDLTCLVYHYETQPSPNPLSWYFHHLPIWSLKSGVAFNHLTELIVPFGFFGPRPVRTLAGALTILFQATLIMSGNLSWLNYLTIVIAIACFDDSFWAKIFQFNFPKPKLAGISPIALSLLAVLVVGLSINPTWNLLSNNQLMNASFESLHLVNTYGAFGSITRERMEVVIEGTDDDPKSPTASWKEYGFKGKVGDVNRMPPQITPYHYKLDWQMWFAAMSSYQYNPWIISLAGRLLQDRPEVVGLLRINPFRDHPPVAIRAKLYHYKFASSDSKAWWAREFVREYFPPLSLTDPVFHSILEKNGWLL